MHELRKKLLIIKIIIATNLANIAVKIILKKKNYTNLFLQINIL